MLIEPSNGFRVIITVGIPYCLSYGISRLRPKWHKCKWQKCDWNKYKWIPKKHKTIKHFWIVENWNSTLRYFLACTGSLLILRICITISLRWLKIEILRYQCHLNFTKRDATVLWITKTTVFFCSKLIEIGALSCFPPNGNYNCWLNLIFYFQMGLSKAPQNCFFNYT